MTTRNRLGTYAMLALALAVLILILRGCWGVQAQTPTSDMSTNEEISDTPFPYVDGVDVTRIVLAYSGNEQTRLWRIVDERYDVVCYLSDVGQNCYRIGDGK